MKKSFVFLAVTALTAAMLGSCQEKKAVEAPVLEIIGQTEVTLPSQAGEFEIIYSIENPSEEGKVTAVSAAEWITEKSHEGEVLSFTVTENTGTDERSTVISVKYTYADGVSEKEVTVTQAGIEEIPADYNIHAGYFWGEYYGDEDEDGRFVYQACISEKALGTDLTPGEEGLYYYLEILGDEAPNKINLCPDLGEYKVDALGNGENHIVSKDNSRIVIIDSQNGMSEVKIKEGTLNVSINNDGNYVFELHVTDSEGKIHKMIYDGKQPMFMDKSPKHSFIEEDFDLDIKYCKISGEPFQGLINATIMLSDKDIYTASDVEAGCIVIEVLMPYDPNGNIHEGEYKVNENYENFTIRPGKEIEASNPLIGSMAKKFDATGWTQYGLLTEGTMTVSGNKDNYEISCNFVTREGIKVTGTYSGPAEIEGLPDVLSTLTEDYVLDLTDASAMAIFREGGEWYMELSTDGFPSYNGDNFQISFVTEGQTAEEGIASGTYKAAESGRPQAGEYMQGYGKNEMGSCSGTLFFNGLSDNGTYNTIAPAIEGDFIVTNMGNDEYSVSFAFKDDMGFTWSGEWSGHVDIRDYSK